MKVLDVVRQMKNLDINVSIVNVDKDKGFRVQATLIEFEGVESGNPKVKKKANAYHEAVSLDDAQTGAVERAGTLLGLGV